MERFIENTMYASRWLLAPIYLGLSLGLLILALKFFQEIIHVLPNVFTMLESEVILLLLSLIDMALVGGLLVMVMISGYENFVSQLDIDENKEKLNWLGTMDSSLAEDESGGVHRGDFLDPPAAHLHGRQERRSPAPDVVRDHPHDLRGLGLCHGLPGQADQALMPWVRWPYCSMK